MMSRTCMSATAQHTLEHDQSVAANRPALTGSRQILDEFGEIARLTGHRLGNAF